MKRTAIIGYGGEGHWHATQATGGEYYYIHVEKSDVIEVAGVYDIRESQLELARERGLHTYASLDELLADDSVDIVVVATPNDSHEELCIKAIEAGKNVICEKPVTLTTESLERIIECADKNKKLFSVYQNRRWDIYFLLMKQLHETGEIGEIISLETRVHGANGVPGDWRLKKEYGGGMLYDWGVHMIDQALWMLGYDVDRVYCTFEHLTTDEVDDGFYLDLYLRDNTKVRIEVNTYNFIPLPLIYMRGTCGTAIVRDWSNRCEVKHCKDWHDKSVIPVKCGNGLSKTMAPRSDESISSYELKHPQVDVHDYYRNFCAAIDGREELIVKHDQIREVLKVIEAAQKSAETGNIVKL